MNAPLKKLHPSLLEPVDDADHYGIEARRIPQHIKRRAAVEWDALDDLGRLPDGWVCPVTPTGEGKEI